MASAEGGEMTTDDTDVHTEHCCVHHGCKYAYDFKDDGACSVRNGTKKQSYPCEVCELAEEEFPAWTPDLSRELRQAYHDAMWNLHKRTYGTRDVEVGIQAVYKILKTRAVGKTFTKEEIDE